LPPIGEVTIRILEFTGSVKELRQGEGSLRKYYGGRMAAEAHKMVELFLFA